MIDENDFKDISFNQTDKLISAVNCKGHHQKWAPTKIVDSEAEVNREINLEPNSIGPSRSSFNDSYPKSGESLFNENQPKPFNLDISDNPNNLKNEESEDPVDFCGFSQRSPIRFPFASCSELPSVSVEVDSDDLLTKRTSDQLKFDNTEEFELGVKKFLPSPVDYINYFQEKEEPYLSPNKRFSRQNSIPSNRSIYQSQHNNFSDVQLNQIAESHSLLAMPVITSPQMAEVEEEVKNNERRQVPNGTKTCFSMKLKKDNVLELASVKGKEKEFNQWDGLRDVKKVEVSVEHLRLADNEILENFCMILKQIAKVEGISLDFKNVRYRESVKEEFLERITELLKKSFEEQNFLENIRLIWDRSEGAKIVFQRILKQLKNSASTLRYLDLSFKSTKLHYYYFRMLIRKVQKIQNFTQLKKFRFTAALISTREAKAPLNALALPNVKEFSLNLTCYGPFGRELMEFIMNSLSSMTQIETLGIKLTIKDFRGNDPPEKWIESLLCCIALINKRPLKLKIIISLNKKGERPDVDESFKSLVTIAARSLKMHQIKYLKIGPKVLRAKTFEGMKNIEDFFCANIPK